MVGQRIHTENVYPMRREMANRGIGFQPMQSVYIATMGRRRFGKNEDFRSQNLYVLHWLEANATHDNCLRKFPGLTW